MCDPDNCGKRTGRKPYAEREGYLDGTAGGGYWDHAADRGRIYQIFQQPVPDPCDRYDGRAGGSDRESDKKQIPCQ